MCSASPSRAGCARLPANTPPAPLPPQPQYPSGGVGVKEEAFRWCGPAHCILLGRVRAPWRDQRPDLRWGVLLRKSRLEFVASKMRGAGFAPGSRDSRAILTAAFPVLKQMADNDRGGLLDHMKRHGSRALERASDNVLSDILKEWGFAKKKLTDGSGWVAPQLDKLREKIKQRYPAVEWTDSAIEWAKHQRKISLMCVATAFVPTESRPLYSRCRRAACCQMPIVQKIHQLPQELA